LSFNPSSKPFTFGIIKLMAKQIIHISKVIPLAQDNKVHSFKFVAKGDKKRKAGYIVEMNNAVVTSSNYEKRKMNLKCLDSNEIRWCYYVLLIEFDGHEVII
jgi:hypothetical protein